MDQANEDSFREFVESRSAVLLRLSLLLSGGDRGAAEDLLQNALIKAAGHWQRIEEPEVYVRQILYRQQIGRWRLKWPSREQSVAELPETRTGHGGGDTADAVELRLIVGRAMRRLTTRQRTMLVLRYYEDLPEGDVAELLGCSVGTVRSTTYRALGKLRSMAPELSAFAPGESPQNLSEVGP
ncbi:SigE family RNA polymerase sigma factor [Streptomyces sp. NBC_00457]|uniref:SigE family RNA polymerase sigma factor n=1 Tax=Streptomyces sp. NBC_00457 TaxID=2975748 RepID=UPI002E23C75E